MNSDYSMEKRTAYRFSILSTLNMRCVAELYTRKHKLSTAGWRILSIIGRFEPVFPGVAGQLSTMDPDKVTRAVDRLVEMGLVVRNTDAADRRRVILCLSSKGHTVYDEIESASQEIEAELRSAVSAQEWAQFSAVLDKLEAQGKLLFTEEAAHARFADRARTATKKAVAGKKRATTAVKSATAAKKAKPPAARKRTARGAA
jgi:DNA-binding MarR family transcriptional regulator